MLSEAALASASIPLAAAAPPSDSASASSCASETASTNWATASAQRSSCTPPPTLLSLLEAVSISIVHQWWRRPSQRRHYVRGSLEPLWVTPGTTLAVYQNSRVMICIKLIQYLSSFPGKRQTTEDVMSPPSDPSTSKDPPCDDPLPACASPDDGRNSNALPPAKRRKAPPGGADAASPRDAAPPARGRGQSGRATHLALRAPACSTSTQAPPFWAPFWTPFCVADGAFFSGNVVKIFLPVSILFHDESTPHVNQIL